MTGANHKTTEKILEFPGSAGDWGKKLTCNEHHWATSVHMRYATDSVPTSQFVDTPLEHLGVVQMRLKCQTVPTTDEDTFEGIVFPYGQDSGSPGRLETGDPTIWQQGLTEGDLKPWGYFIDCEHFIRGAKVQTDQNNEQLSVLPEEIAETVGQQGFIGDMVGINDVKFTCHIYSEFCVC